VRGVVRVGEWGGELKGGEMRSGEGCMVDLFDVSNSVGAYV